MLALARALFEARRFVDAADVANARTPKGSLWVEGGTRAAALRRASLDLTRALAELRRSR